MGLSRTSGRNKKSNSVVYTGAGKAPTLFHPLLLILSLLLRIASWLGQRTSKLEGVEKGSTF